MELLKERGNEIGEYSQAIAENPELLGNLFEQFFSQKFSESSDNIENKSTNETSNDQEPITSSSLTSPTSGSSSSSQSNTESGASSLPLPPSPAGINVPSKTSTLSSGESSSVGSVASGSSTSVPAPTGGASKAEVAGEGVSSASSSGKSPAKGTTPSDGAGGASPVQPKSTPKTIKGGNGIISIQCNGFDKNGKLSLKVQDKVSFDLQTNNLEGSFTRYKIIGTKGIIIVDKKLAAINIKAEKEGNTKVSFEYLKKQNIKNSRKKTDVVLDSITLEISVTEK